MLSIQNVRKQTGISVRTLRYYDEIGLLPPAGKTEGGHRLYSDKEMQKLREIQFLKTLKFTLKEINIILSDDDWDWAKELQNQLELVTEEKKRIIEIEKTLIGLMNSVTFEGELNIDATMKLIQLFQKKATHRDMYRKQFFATKKEQALLEKLPNMNSNDPDSIEWLTLLSQLKQEMYQGIDAPIIQQIIARFYEKTMETFGEDNEAFFDTFWDVRTSPEKSEQVGFYPIEQEVLDFFEKAWDYFVAHRKHDTD